MAIDRTRLRDYLQQMRDLEKQVSQDNFIRRFEEKLLDLLARNQIDTDDLTFIRNEIERLFKPEFAEFDTRLKRTYNDVLEVVNELYDDIGSNMSRQFSKLRAVEQVNQLQLGDYEQATIKEIARKVRDGVVEDLSHSELKRQIRELGGKARTYADTLAGTQLKRYGRVSKYNKSLIAGVTIFEYAGVLRETTRPFCRACLHKLFHINNILNMLNGNLEPVIINCGGWNCIHDWEPDPTASREDAVSGKMFSLPGGARIYGDTGTAKQFSYSVGLESLVNRDGVEAYIKKVRERAISQARVDYIKRHYPDLTDAGIRSKIGQIRQNPDKVYYQYNKGPRIVFEKNGEFTWVSAGKGVHSMYKPSDLQKYKDLFVQYFVELEDYR